eukprot:gene25527-31997_t
MSSLPSFAASGGVSALESLMDLDVDDNNEEDEEVLEQEMADLLASTKKVVKSLTNGYDSDSDEEEEEEEETEKDVKTPLKLKSANNTPSNTPSTGVKSAVKVKSPAVTTVVTKNADGLTAKAAEKLKEKEEKQALKAEKRALTAAAELLKKTTAANAVTTPKIVKNGNGADSSSKPTPKSAPVSAVKQSPFVSTKGVDSGLLLSAMKSPVSAAKSPAKHVTVNTGTSTGRDRSSSSHAPPALRLEDFTSKSFESTGSPVTSPATTVSDSSRKKNKYEALSAESSDEEEAPFSVPSARPSVFSVKKDRKSLTSTTTATATATGAQSANVIYGLPSPVSDMKEVVKSPESASKKAKLEVNLFALSQLYEGRNSLRAAEKASKEEYDVKIAADAADALARKKAKKITLKNTLKNKESKVDREKVIVEPIPPLPTISSPNKVGRPRKIVATETVSDKKEKKRKSLESVSETVVVSANKVGRKRKSASTGDGDVFVPSSPATTTEKVEGSNRRERKQKVLD